jgi:ligand-binding sensor domain-containing protein
LYDGYVWTYIQTTLQDPLELLSNLISTLYCDPVSGLMLAGTNTGVSYFRNERWLGNALSGDQVLAITRAGDSTYWIGTDAGLVLWDMASGAVERFHCPTN